MAKVSELGYLGVGASELAAWRGLATTVFGMQVVAGDTGSTLYLRMDHHHHRIELNAGGARTCSSPAGRWQMLRPWMPSRSNS